MAESTPLNDAGPGPRPTLTALRPRLYKAIRTTILGPADAAAPREALARWLNTLFQEAPPKVTFPEELAEAQRAAFQAGLERAGRRGRQLAGAWFSWDPALGDWVQELRQAVAQVAQGDEAAPTRSPRPDLPEQELTGLLLHRLRQRWCGGPAAAETFRVDTWLTELAFLSRELMEIGTFARLFHAVALIHREGLTLPDTRDIARHQVLRKVKDGRPLKTLEELVIYLESQITPGEAGPLGPFPDPPVDPELFPGQDLTALGLLLREALTFLSGGDREPGVKQRLNWLEEHRDLLDLKDLLLAFLSRVREKDPLPPPMEVLDLLKRQGYPIRHEDFRDEYRALLAPLATLPASAGAVRRWPLDPARLTGDPEADLDRRPEQEERRRLWLQTFQEEALALAKGQGEPLPQGELIRPAACFAVAWLAAQRFLAAETAGATALAEEAAGLLPPALLKLIRPRKGYELQHKGELNRLLQQEAQAYYEALARCRRLGRVTSTHDERLLFRLAAARALMGPEGKGLPDAAGEAKALDLPRVLASLGELAARWTLDLEPARAPLWHDFREWLQERLNWPSLLALGEDLGLPASAWEGAAARLFEELARQFYRLVVARARAELGLPPLPGDRELLFWLAAWFTPERQAFWEGASYLLLGAIRERARRAVWESYPLTVESRDELVSLIKYFLDEELGGQDPEAYARRQQISLLPEKVTAPLQKCLIPPELLGAGGLAAAVQEVLRPRAPEVSQAQRDLEEEVLSWLPRTDCGSCGSPGCLTFARLLVQGRAPVAQCLQAPPEVGKRLGELLALVPPQVLAPEPYAVTAEDRARLTHLLDPYFQALRQGVAQEVAAGGRRLVPLSLDEVSILQIGKSPDGATFHRYVEDYLGFEAAHRLTPADLAFLAEHGEARLAAESRDLEQSFSWLEQETRAGLSGAALAQKDPATRARAAYSGAIFLADLSAADQARVQEFRLRQYLPGFLREWEQALPEHWQAGYRIEDWQDFSQIVAKSYWHQEHTPAPGEILRELGPELASGPRLKDLGNSFSDGLVQEQLTALEGQSRRLEALLARRRVASAADLDFLSRGFTARAWLELKPGEAAPGPEGDRLGPLVRRAFHLLDQTSLAIPGGLRAYWDEMAPRVQEILAADPQVPPLELARLQGSTQGLAWREMHTLRQGWLKALVQAAAETLLREEQEVERFRRGDLPTPTPGTVRRAVRQLYWSGVKTGEDIREAIRALLDRYPGAREALGEAAMVRRTWDRLESRAFLRARAEEEPLTRALDRLLKARTALDLKKLKAYMFLLARMEGNLDKLTALLREIRETSDSIEAAWLSFTEERVRQPAAASASPEGRTPLLISRLPDRERINRYLTDGLPRGEPRDYTQAYRELHTLLEFYVVTGAPEASPEEILATLEAGPYDLEDLSREALLGALAALAQQRERLLPRKIGICTYVLGHRLAVGSPGLAQSEAQFLKEKSGFLKSEALPAELHKGSLAGGRGVELGKIRNELYRQISDLLTEERTASFARRIGQIIDRLEEERRAALAGFKRGELNQATAHYLLRRFQKDQARVPVSDLCRFLRQYQPEKLAEVRTRLAPKVVAQVNRRLEEILSTYRAALAG